MFAIDLIKFKALVVDAIPPTIHALASCDCAPPVLVGIQTLYASCATAAAAAVSFVGGSSE